MTEVMKDVAFRMLPITTSDAKSMLNELRAQNYSKDSEVVNQLILI